MRGKPLSGQLSLLLFAETRADDPKAAHIEWLRKARGLDDEGIELAERVFDAFPSMQEAIERCKAINVANGSRKLVGWETSDAVDIIGVLDPSLEYHVCWDRAWAARNGCPKQDVPRVVAWDWKRLSPVYGESREAAC